MKRTNMLTRAISEIYNNLIRQNKSFTNENDNSITPDNVEVTVIDSKNKIYNSQVTKTTSALIKTPERFILNITGEDKAKIIRAIRRYHKRFISPTLREVQKSVKIPGLTVATIEKVAKIEGFCINTYNRKSKSDYIIDFAW